MRYKETQDPSPVLKWKWRVKNKSVNISSLDTNLVSYLNTLEPEFQEMILATSGNDSKVHTKTSRHYKSKAVDLRMNERLYSRIKSDPNRQKYGVTLLDPYHGTSPHLHLSTGQGTENAMDVYFKTKDVHKTKTVNKTKAVNNSPNIELAYNFFIGKGLTPAQSAGIVGNLAQESTPNLDPKLENSIGAYGIAQWYKGRRRGLETFAKEEKGEPDNIKLQLKFIWHELESTEKGALEYLKQADTAQEAAEIFVNKFERSGEKPGDKGYDNRIKYANEYYNQFNGTQPTNQGEMTGSTPDNEMYKQNTETSLLPEYQVDITQDLQQDIKALQENYEQQYKDLQASIRGDDAKQRLQQKVDERNFIMSLVKDTSLQFVEMDRHTI